MKFEDLKRVWREEGTGGYKRVRIEDLSAAHGRASNHLNRLVRWIGPFLMITLFFTIPVFGWGAINAPRPLLAWPGAVLLWGWLAYQLAVWWNLRKAKPDPGLPVRDAVHAELARLRMLERFRENVPWSLPIFIVGEVLIFVGASGDPRESLWTILTFSAAVLGLAAWGRRRNRRELERVVRPLREELESWIVDLEELELGSVNLMSSGED